MNFIKLVIKRPTAVAMAALAILFTGLASLGHLPLELTPNVSFPKLSVVTRWPDTSPETMEAFVTSPIEAVANTVTNVRSVNSISEEGQSAVDIEFNRGTHMDFAAMELSEKLSLVRENFPYGVLPPQIQKYVPKEFQTGRFLSYHLTGNVPLAKIRQYALSHIRTSLLSIEGVADVQVFGGQDPELQIEIDPQKLRTFGLSVQQITSVLHDLNVRLASGKIIRETRQYDLIAQNPPANIQQIRNRILTSRRGSLIRVGDVAAVHFGTRLPRSLTRINGNPAVVISIEKEIGTNTIKVADRVFNRLAQLKKNFPPGLRLIKERDQSQKIRKALSRLSSRAIFSIAVIFLILLLFLRNLISPIVILSSIFFSVLLTINLFYFAHVGLNLLTLAGLALGFGMLVDNSIVVFDNIHRCYGHGLTPLEAALKGTGDVALPIVASTLTTVAAFIPFLYLTGELRIYYLPFALAVGLSLLSSLLVAFTLIPSLTVQILKHKAHGPSQILKSTVNLQETSMGYVRFLAFFLRHKGFTIFVTLLLFAGSYYLFDRYVTKGRIWSWGEDTYLLVTIRMPTGSEIARTDSLAVFFESKLVGHPNIDKTYTDVYPEYARIEIQFAPAVRYTAFPLILRDRLINIATQIGGANVGVFGFGQGFTRGGVTAPSFSIEVLGYNFNEVRHIAEKLGKKLKRNPRIRNVNTNASFWWSGSNLFETVLHIDLEKLDRFHLTVEQVLQDIRSYLQENLSWQRIRLQGREIDIRLKMRHSREFSMADLKRLILTDSQKEQVRLSQVAFIGQRQVMARIVRKNQQYQRLVSFEFRGPWQMGDKYLDEIIKSSSLLPGYKMTRAKFFFLQETEKRQIYWVMAFSLLLVYMVTAGLFESLVYPFVVILTVPMALIGVFLIFYLTGANFDRSAYIGVILLAGIVVNNAIVLVDHINSLRRKGLVLPDAIIQGARDRVRPILMTSLTTILGLFPLVLFGEAQKGIWYALSLSTIGGLVSSTLLVLIVIPVVYVIFSKSYIEE
ncbi:Efflux pump membrane transporter BepE [bacterium BMS3Bbin03]|nr:Efflux pump membrane transporter BepE [bacterium BMS3Bbin03]